MRLSAPGVLTHEEDGVNSHEEAVEQWLGAMKSVAKKAEEAAPHHPASAEQFASAARQLAEAWAWLQSASQSH
jgi:hypothetical protein